MSTIDTTLFLNLMSTFVKKITVPGDFSSQAKAIEKMLSNDVTGVIDSLTDFAVESATVDYGIETDNITLNKILENWLRLVNKDYKGKVPPGIQAVAKEYFKERWKGASFPVLKITKWANFDGLRLPSRMFFVNGGDIIAHEKNDKDECVTLFSYDYYLCDITNPKNKLDAGTIFSRPYGRWFDKYPVPYLIKKGVYYNYKIIQSLKQFGQKILEEIIPYLMIIKKGNAEFTKQGKTYSDVELKSIYQDIQNMLREAKDNQATANAQTKIRVTDYAEEIKHLIPDLETAFSAKLFVQSERNILSGLGFIDVIEGVSDTRKESILNPKVFIGEVRGGIEDFKQILFQLVLLIIEANKRNKKYMTKTFNITSSPVKSFMTSKFKQELRLLWKNGQISNKTYAEMVGEVDYRTEVIRRETEARDGTEITMYPHITDNRESDISPQEQQRNDKLGLDDEEDKNGNPIPDDKVNQKENFDLSSEKETIIRCPKCNFEFDMLKEIESHMGWVKCPKCGKEVTQKNIIKSNNKLEIAPYKSPKDLPSSIKKSLAPGLQKTFVSVFNKALNAYNSESRAFRVAWSVIKKIGRKNNKGLWVRKRQRTEGKLIPIKLTRGIITDVLEKEDKIIIHEAMQLKKLENEHKKSDLLDKLLGKKSKG